MNLRNVQSGAKITWLYRQNIKHVVSHNFWAKLYIFSPLVGNESTVGIWEQQNYKRYETRSCGTILRVTHELKDKENYDPPPV